MLVAEGLMYSTVLSPYETERLSLTLTANPHLCASSSTDPTVPLSIVEI